MLAKQHVASSKLRRLMGDRADHEQGDFMLIYAHRGLHGASVPENSMAAFHAAASDGFGIETDLRTDRTGRLILFHDRLVGGIPVEELDQTDVARLAGRPIPILDDLLAADTSTPLNLEVKTQRAWEALRPYLRQGLPQDVLLSSFIHSIAEAASRHHVQAAYLMASAPAAPAQLPPLRPNLSSIVWAFNVVDPVLIAQASQQGFRNLVYDAITDREHQMLFEAQCDGVITDTPHAARRACSG